MGRLSHYARGALSAENARRAMMLRGFTPNGHRLWDQFEQGNLRNGHPNYSAVMLLNPRRTRPAHHSKAGRMGITRPRSPEWGDNELHRLHRLYPRAGRAEIMAALPGRSWGAICRRARKDGYRRPRRSITPTGYLVLDQVLKRAIERNVTLLELDAATRSKRYFSRRRWKGRALNLAYVARAIEYLGGSLRASFGELSRQ